MTLDFSVRRNWRVLAATSAVALACVVPALAQEAKPTPEPAPAPAAEAAAPAPAAAAEQAVAPGKELLTPTETPATIAAEPPKPAEAKIVETPAQAVPAADPVLVAVRDRLAKGMANVDKADSAAMSAFYAKRSEGPLWTKNGAFTPGATAAMAALKRANDWGLDAKAYELPQLASGADTTALADADVKLSMAVLKYARHASGGRIDPSTLSRFNDQRGTFADPSAVLAALAATDKADAYLEGLHPKHPQFVKLQQALVKALHGGEQKAEAAAAEPAHLSLAAGPAVKPGETHADIVAIRAHFGQQAEAGNEQVYDAVLADAVKAFQKEHNLKANGVLTSATRTALNGGAPKKVAANDPAREIDRIVLNMERWRWLPADMGAFHIENNIPEYTTRVYKDGQVVHQEKIIVGKTNTPTSIFSANMQFVIFHPEWGVPDSIKVKEIWPYLKRKADDDFFGFGGSTSDTSVLKRHNLRVSYNGRPVDASQVDWTKADPRSYQFIQPAGGANVLGVVKFRFPNRHDIYMHDTPQRELFSQSTRAFSHGCMRVNNPRRLAEVILAEDRGWTVDKVGSALAGHGTQEVKLDRPFPVHVTYFTARVDDDGKLKTFADLYGHDAKLASALAGRPVTLEAPSVTSGDTFAQAGGEGGRKPKKGAQAKQKEAGLGGFFDGLFGN